MSPVTVLGFPSPLAMAMLGPWAWWLPVVQAGWSAAGAVPVFGLRVALPMGTCGMVVAGGAKAGDSMGDTA